MKLFHRRRKLEKYTVPWKRQPKPDHIGRWANLLSAAISAFALVFAVTSGCQQQRTLDRSRAALDSVSGFLSEQGGILDNSLITLRMLHALQEEQYRDEIARLGKSARLELLYVNPLGTPPFRTDGLEVVRNRNGQVAIFVALTNAGSVPARTVRIVLATSTPGVSIREAGRSVSVASTPEDQRFEWGYDTVVPAVNGVPQYWRELTAFVPDTTRTIDIVASVYWETGVLRAVRCKYYVRDVAVTKP